MNGRSWLVTFFLFLFLLAIIVLQVLSMVQAERLYERFDSVLNALRRGGIAAAMKEKGRTEKAGLPMEEYPGDEGDWLVWSLPGEPTTLYDVLATSTWASRWIVTGNIFESLIEYEPDAFKFRGRLAEDFFNF